MSRHFPAKDEAGLAQLPIALLIVFGDENPWNTDETRSHAAAVLDRGRDVSAIRSDLTVDDWQALMCGLSAAIATGADAARQAEFFLSAVRAH